MQISRSDELLPTIVVSRRMACPNEEVHVYNMDTGDGSSPTSGN